MATYAIGDIQGCMEPLRCLLEQVSFDPTNDTLWFAGDLVNRGPQSLEVLRFVRELGERAITVLGNHDLHLVAVAHGVRKPSRKDTFDAILAAPDRDELIAWLCSRPLIHHDAGRALVMAHAGIPPCWSLEQAIALGNEVSDCLQSPKREKFLKAMYGNTPHTWSPKLKGTDRLRVITNYFTRMRFCTADGKLDLDSKEGIGKAPKGFDAWFRHPNPSLQDTGVIFGHWAALEGKADTEGVHALDTGCVWGARLRAMRLEDKALFHCDC